MSGFARPAAEVDKLVAAWALWADKSETPGRTMADLKIGGLDMILEELSADSEAAAAMFGPWTAWEKGKLPPQPALDGLEEHGLADLIEAISQTS